MKIIPEAFTFDDVLLIPAYSSILPMNTLTHTKLTNKISLSIPIISAAMDTVTNIPMAIALAQAGGIGILHRHVTIAEQVNQIKEIKATPVDENKTVATLDANKNLAVGAAVGTDAHSQDRIAQLYQADVDIIVIDTAHGHSQLVIDMVKWSKNNFGNLPIIAGNIVTAQAAIDLVHAGADAVKVGVGPGAACTTRMVTGVGFPQLSAILNIAHALSGSDVTIIADGGIRNSGDLAKGLAAGAHSVMLGQLLAATDQAPGEIIIENGKTYKHYRGMHSRGALADKHSIQDPHFAQSQEKFIPEGAEGKILYKGSLDDVLFQLMGGLRSAMGYLGCATIEELHQKAQFVRISPMTFLENQPHGLK